MHHDLTASSSYVSSVEGTILPTPVLIELMLSILEQNKSFRFVTPGFSMSPFIRHGDMVTVDPLGDCALKVGDVVAYLQPDSDTDRLVIHRIVAIKHREFFLQGDNCPVMDGVIPPDSIIGVITRVERHGRQVRSALGYRGRWIAKLNTKGWLFPVKSVFNTFLRLGARVLRRSQRLPVFRLWIKRFRPEYVIQEADAVDMIFVHSWLNAQSDSPKYMRDPNVSDFVCKHGDEVLGFIQLARRSSEQALYNGYWLHSLKVRTRYRGLGLGEALTQCVIDQALEEDATELFLTVFVGNNPAIALYKKMGFKQVIISELEKQFEENESKGMRKTMCMRKALR